MAGMPFFRYPKTAAEMSYFMQKNDVFVQVFISNTSLCSLRICSIRLYGKKNDNVYLLHIVCASKLQ